MEARGGARAWSTQLATRPLTAGLALLALYAVLSLLMDPGGYLGTDTGAKVYTLEVMDRNDTFSPDVGYWAEDLDPDGRVHPLYQTVARADGSWVAVTTLPVLEVGRVLYGVGGYRATLLLPMLGSIATAFAARSVARRVGAAHDGWPVFWVVGLASPAVIYALDFWEHSIGMACMVGAVALLLSVLDGSGLRRAVAAGALLGSSAVLRNETFVYALVTVGAVCLTQALDGRLLRRAASTGLACVGGFALPWVANIGLERAVDGPSRASRTTGTATRVAEDSGERVREGLQTLVGLNSGSFAQSILLGVVVVAVVLAAFRAEARGDTRFARLCLGGVAVGYLADALGGLGFVSGLLLAFPLAIAGLVPAGRTRNGRVVTIIAVVSLPLVYAFQYLGGGGPQWGGRYTLTSGILLGTVGLVGVAGRFPISTKGLVAVSCAVTVLGVAWLGVRSHGVDEFFDEVAAESEPVVIARNAFLIREGGDAVVDRRWFSTKDEATFTLAVDLTRQSGEDGFTVLEWNGIAPPDSALPDDVIEVERRATEFVDVPVGVVTYEFVP